MIQDLSKEVLDRIDALAAKLGTTVDFLWPLMVRKEVIEGIMEVVLGLVLFGVCFLMQKKIKKASSDTFGDESGKAFARLFSGFILGLPSVMLLYEGLLQIFIPEVQALQSILSFK